MKNCIFESNEIIMSELVKKSSKIIIKDYYKILDIDKKVNTLVIKKKFRKLVRKLHPDVNKSTNSHEEFIDVVEAYEVLSHRLKRIQYDKLYDLLILKKNIKNSDEKSIVWKEHIEASAKKGKVKGEKYASESNKKFKKRLTIWKSGVIFDVILEIFWWIFRVVFEIIIFGA